MQTEAYLCKQTKLTHPAHSLYITPGAVPSQRSVLIPPTTLCHLFWSLFKISKDSVVRGIQATDALWFISIEKICYLWWKRNKDSNSQWLSKKVPEAMMNCAVTDTVVYVCPDHNQSPEQEVWQIQSKEKSGELRNSLNKEMRIEIYTYELIVYRASLIAQLVKNPPAMQEIPVWFLGQDDHLQKGQTTHSSILGLPLWLSW